MDKKTRIKLAAMIQRASKKERELILKDFTDQVAVDALCTVMDSLASIESIYPKEDFIDAQIEQCPVVIVEMLRHYIVNMLLRTQDTATNEDLQNSLGALRDYVLKSIKVDDPVNLKKKCRLEVMECIIKGNMHGAGE